MRKLKEIIGHVTRHMELCNLELKCSVSIFSPQILISELELRKPLVCILTKLSTGLSRNGGSFPDSGKNYFSYLKNCPWNRQQSMQAYD
jgi:hypothetical protein